MLRLNINSTPERDPAGIINHAHELTVAPTVATAARQIQIQTSNKNKIIKAWGLPQA